MSNGRRRRALLDEPAHPEAVRVGPAVHELVHRAGVAVEREHDVHGVGEQLAEQRLVHAVRVVRAGGPATSGRRR
jgi:hypothetical protein